MNNYIKLLIILNITFLFTNILNSQEKPLPVIHSNLKNITYRINGVSGGWNIVPEVKPDILSVSCDKPTMDVKFITDLDTISYVIKEMDTVLFNIVLNQKDTALTGIVGLRNPAKFSSEYIKNHMGKAVTESPEVHELANIIFAVTDKGQKDSNMIDMSSEYHGRVRDYFLQYKNHPAVLKFDSLAKASYWNYYNIRMNSCAYIFDGNKIRKEGTYERMGFGTVNLFEDNLKLIQDFADSTDFRKFYKYNTYYYNSLIKQQEEKVDLDKMWKWLEHNFPARYQSYRVIFSPLIAGSHSTQRFSDNNFSQTVMFICGPEVSGGNKRYSDAVWSGILARIVFTEIDHNYVNPVTDMYAQEVNEVFKDLDKWATKEGYASYNSPYAVFNEYMTFAVFTLYIYDHYEKKDFDAINRVTEQMMPAGRGFYRFNEFNRKLLDLYINREKGQKASDFYPDMLEWARELD